MAEPRIWATSEDGSVEYVSMTKELLVPSIEAMQKSFYMHENVCVAFNVPNQPESFPELDALMVRAAQDGVSIAAVDKATGTIAGAAFNKLEEPGQADFYLEYIKSCKHSGSRGVVQWMNDIENMFNVYEYCKVNALLEIMFLGTVPSFRKRGIAKKLFEVSIDLAKRLKNGDNVKVSITNNEQMEVGNPPELVTSICTSFVTQKITKDLDFSIGSRIDFNKFVYDGKSLRELIGGNTPFLTYDILRL